MARIYLEALEQVTEEAEFIRLDVTNKTQAEQDDIIIKLKDFMTGITCTFQRHNCPHDGNPPNTPCTMEEI